MKYYSIFKFIFILFMLISISSCVRQAVVSWKLVSGDYQQLEEIQDVLRGLNYQEVLVDAQSLPENVKMRFFRFPQNETKARFGINLISKCSAIDEIQFVEGGVSDFTDSAKLHLFELEKQLKNSLGHSNVKRLVIPIDFMDKC